MSVLAAWLGDLIPVVSKENAAKLVAQNAASKITQAEQKPSSKLNVEVGYVQHTDSLAVFGD